MTAGEVGGGRVMPFAAQAVAGKGGAVTILFILFMACTSIASAQLIAMSSGYIKPNANNKQLNTAFHIGAIGSALFVSSFATALHKGDVDLNWTLYMLGIVVCPSIFSTIFTLLWRGQRRAAAIISPIIGIMARLRFSSLVSRCRACSAA
jgi:Na+/proline symporter